MRIRFNKNKQWIDVYIEKESPDWGNFLSTWKKPDEGVFGEMRFYKNAKRDSIVHEVFHAVAEHAHANKQTARRHEEFYASMSDELFRKIEKKLEKLGLI